MKNKSKEQAGGVTHKKDINAGSGALNHGSEQDPNYDKDPKFPTKKNEQGSHLFQAKKTKNQRWK